jgi:hypothetical protein
MSKAVKSVGRSINKVVSGAVKAVKNSKVLKAVAIAAAVYFTGGAVLGAMGGASAASAAGSSVIAGAAKGAVAGLGSAGAGISSAWSSLMGGSLSGAGSAIKGGMTGAQAAGGGAASGGFGSALKSGYTATKGLLNPNAAAASSGGFIEMGDGATTLNAPTGGAAATSSNIASMSVEEMMKMPVESLRSMSSQMTAEQVSALKQAGIDLAPKQGLLRSMASNPLALPVAMNVTGNAMAGYGAARQEESVYRRSVEDMERRSQEDRDRYGTNVGTRLWNSKY